MIKVEQLSKKFGDVQALQQLSFQANDGEITGILGPNGAGKTTCLRTIYGLLKADSGSASIDGVNASSDPLLARSKLGIFPDKFGLYERLSAYEQIDYFASLHGMKGKTKQQAIERVIEQLGIQDLAARRSTGFSQGQRMKVTLAQALVHQPQNLILDEPSRGLDIMSSRILRDYLLEQKQQGRCIVFSSHVMQEIVSLCDKVVIVANGKLAAQGSPQQLCQQMGETELEEAFVKIIATAQGEQNHAV